MEATSTDPARAVGIPTARSVDHFAFTVPNLDQAIEFFTDVLGCELVYRAGPFEDPDGNWMETALHVHPQASLHLAMLRGGPTTNFELFEYTSPDAADAIPRNSDVGGHHVCFYVDDIDQAVDYLRAIDGVVVMGDPTPVGSPQPNAGSRFVYFKTPWGLQMELVSAPGGMAYEENARRRTVPPARAWTDSEEH